MNHIRATISILLLTAATTVGGCTESSDETAKARAALMPAPRFDSMVVAEGTRITVSLDTPINTDVNRTGDPFVVTTIEPVIVDGTTVLPTGTKIHGVLQDVQSSGRVSGRARMTLAYQEFSDEAGDRHAISTLPLTLQAASSTHSDIEKIAAGGVVGAVIGGIAGGGKGAVIGAGVGVGAGTILMLATKGDDLALEVGQRMSVLWIAPTTVQVAVQR
jgi:hypothetical protein